MNFWVTTPSGGTDSFIALVKVVTRPLGPSIIGEAASDADALPEGPNPTRGRFALNAPWARGAVARLTIYDVSGRQVAVIRGRPGTQLVWEGKDRSGGRATPGLYLYRLEVGKRHRHGKVVVFR